MRVCLGGPWNTVGRRYAHALADDNALNLQYRWLPSTLDHRRVHVLHILAYSQNKLLTF